MALVKTPKSRIMGMVFVKEVVDGKEKLETRRFKNLKDDASLEDIKMVSDEIAKISVGTFNSLVLTEESNVQ